MLQFRTKKSKRWPWLSILIWVSSLILMLVLTFLPHLKEDVFGFAIRPKQFLELLATSNIYIFELFSSLMLHANWNHWLGNMIAFLLIAPALEKRLGVIWFIVIYFGSGFIGNVYSVYQLQESMSTLVGASGAISGLLGAWLMLFPRHEISIIIPIGLYFERAKIPLVIVIFIWLLLQFLFQYLGSFNHPVVWAAHIVGFLGGLLLSFIYRITH